MTPLAFLDFEASGLGPDSYPIEIGWVLDDGTGEAHLIRPEPDWKSWSVGAEALHGLSWDVLASSGRPATEVATICLKALRGRRVFTDAPGADQFWLDRLMKAAGASCSLEIFPFSDALRLSREPLWHRLTTSGIERGLAEAAYRDLARRLTAQAFAEEAAGDRVRHRAFEDAASLWRIWSGLNRACGAWAE
ncbi:3'-5' exonuclease [Falsiroseomonas sp. E2-1-a20]|uniref:3'-5' exonuclease n=1 Tax=Falsiroseomonas sp. E2-1-a20 TaxID=3239300 RepID=UPI003F3B5206